MANLPISELPSTTAITHSDLLAIVQGGTTKKITYEDFHSEAVIDAGSVSGATSVDLSTSHWFKFTLTDDVQIVLNNGSDGETYLFWVYSNGNYAVNSMVYTGGSVYSVGGSLPNPANNAWNLYQAYAIDGDLILTEIGNFSAI